jgi:hypothetical protein
MPAPKNLCGKTRPLDHPYEIYIAPLRDGGVWEWRILKKYQNPDAERKNAYARWFVAARSPMSFNSWEYGDTYIADIVKYARKVVCEQCERVHADREQGGRYLCSECYGNRGAATE